jgi:hypothetical protein
MRSTSENLLLIGGVLLAVFMVATEPRDEWRVHRTGDPAQVQFTIERTRRTNSWVQSSTVPLADFTGLQPNRGGESKFDYRTDAGTFHCQGRFSFGSGRGRYSFEPDPRFAAALAKLGYDAPRQEDYFGLALSQVTLDFARDVTAAGLRASTADLLDLRRHGVTAAYIREARNAGAPVTSARDMIELSRHGVRLELLRALRQAGYGINSSQIVEIATHGVDESYVRELEINRLKPSPADMVLFKQHGLNPEYLREARDLGYRFDARDLVSLRDHGVSAGYLRAVRAAGDLSARDIQELHNHGVDANFPKAATDLGFHFGINELIELRNRGVDANYLRSMKDSGYASAGVHQIVELRSHGVDAAFPGQARELGFNFSAADIVELRRRGVGIDYLRDLKSTGSTALSAAEIVQLRTRGVDGAFPGQARELGFNFKPSELIELRQRGIGIDYLRGLKSSGAGDLRASDIEQLKTHGVDAAYLGTASSLGFKLAPSQAIELSRQGVNIDYLRGLKDAGAAGLATADIQQLKRAGVDPGFIAASRELGFRFSTRELLDLKRSGVGETYLRHLKDSGLRNLDANQIARLKMHGVE